MTPEQARSIAKLLSDAADRAEAAGEPEVSILPDLAALDDEARAELGAAIKDAADR